MSNLIIARTMFTVESSLKLADLQKIAKENPAALSLVDEKTGKTCFAVYAAQSVSMITADFISFSNATPDGRACVTMGIPTIPAGSNAFKAVDANYGTAIANLNKIEQQVSAKRA